MQEMGRARQEGTSIYIAMLFCCYSLSSYPPGYRGSLSCDGAESISSALGVVP